MKKVIKKTKKNLFTKKEIGEFKPVSFREHFNEEMKNPLVRKAYNDLEPKYRLINEIMHKRIEKNISQKQLAKKLGTGQSAMSRFESGNYNPSYEFLQKLAKALDSELVITFK